MREHKYRAYDKSRNCLFDVQDIQITHNNVWVCSPGDDDSCIMGFVGDDIELLQYTGLHDCNGTPIYEGDIVRCGWHYGDDFGEPVGEMEFTNQVVEYSIGAQGAGFDLNVHGMENAEVIGNIHQHPDLIRKG